MVTPRSVHVAGIPLRSLLEKAPMGVLLAVKAGFGVHDAGAEDDKDRRLQHAASSSRGSTTS